MTTGEESHPLENKGGAPARSKVPRAAHKDGERTLGYKGPKSRKQIPRPAHPITRKTGVRWGPGCGPRDDNGGEPTLKNEGWGTCKGPKVPRAAHKDGERTLGYKGTKSEKQIPRPSHPITRKNGARWGPPLRASG
jgi:hypothetical protein